MNISTRDSCDAFQLSSSPVPSITWPYIAAELLIALLAIAGNFLVCLAVNRNRKLRTVTNYFLVSLSVADIFVGVLAIPCAVLTDLGQPRHNLPLCLLLLSVLIVLTQSSILSLLAVAAERYVAILLPLQYQRIVSPRNARLALILTWCLALFSGSIPLMGWHGSLPPSGACLFPCVVNLSYMVYFNFLGCVLVPLVVMFIIYGHIFLTVRQQLRRIAAGRGLSESRGPMKDRCGSGVSEYKRAVRMRREVRKATSLFLVLFLFMLCWLPLHFLNCVTLMCPRCHVPLPLTLAAILLSHANSALNPLLYAYRMRSFRHTLRALCWMERVDQPGLISGMERWDQPGLISGMERWDQPGLISGMERVDQPGLIPGMERVDQPGLIPGMERVDQPGLIPGMERVDQPGLIPGMERVDQPGLIPGMERVDQPASESKSESRGPMKDRCGSGVSEYKRAVRMRREVRKATSLFLVLFLFMLCWLPLHFLNCVTLMCPRCHVPLPLTLAAILLSHANSALNPLLYAYRMRSFRHTLRALCCTHTA
ncbi:adenosine receptor A1-like [Oncorhynchus clarkii lewisi]|uniref:adenosine receptor A1-like n=1 Tax=Oncorhynchus clarkii lewisi TaxID=490388 RepID=UPI0039B9BC48